MQPSTIQLGINACLAATLLAAPLAFAGRNALLKRASNLLLILGTGIGALSGIVALGVVGSAVRFPLGVAPLGIAFELNRLSAVFFVVVNAVACIASIYAVRYLEETRGTYDVPSLSGATALFVFGMQATLLSTSALAFMTSWEIMSLASFTLVMADRASASRRAALLYFVMAHLGALAIMAGFLLLSGGNPLANFAALAAGARSLTPRETALAFTLFFIGFGSKAGLVPLHSWLPEAHPQAPSHVSALMSGVMLKVAVYGFIVTCMMILPSLPTAAALAVMGVGLVSAAFGALHAAVDVDIKRTLAWSSVENLGIIFLMLGTALYARAQAMPGRAAAATAAALFHCVAHAVFKSGLFLAAGSIAHATHTRSLERMGGLAKRMPALSVSFLALCLAGAALPPFSGFIAEWTYLSGIVGALASATTAQQAVLALALVGTAFTAGIAVFAMVKLFAISQLGAPRSHGAETATEPDAAIRGPVIALAVLTAVGGAFASVVFRATGFGSLLVGTSAAAPVTLAGGTLSPTALAAVILGTLAFAVVARRFLAKNPRERQYHTWDCGQPITARMEYTATAFSAPIRFFFRPFVGIRKNVVVEPATAGGSPLMMRREMLMTGRSFLESHVNEPIANGLYRIGERARRVQSGSIQLYLLFILIALAASLLIAV